MQFHNALIAKKKKEPKLKTDPEGPSYPMQGEKTDNKEARFNHHVYYQAEQHHGRHGDYRPPSRLKFVQGDHGNRMPRLYKPTLRCNERHSIGGEELEGPS